MEEKKKHPFEILQVHYSSPETKHVTFNDFMVNLVVKKKEKLKGTEGTEGVIRSRKLIRCFESCQFRPRSVFFLS
jgi:hypothetical protein